MGDWSRGAIEEALVLCLDIHAHEKVTGSVDEVTRMRVMWVPSNIRALASCETEDVIELHDWIGIEDLL